VGRGGGGAGRGGGSEEPPPARRLATSPVGKRGRNFGTESLCHCATLPLCHFPPPPPPPPPLHREDSPPTTSPGWNPGRSWGGRGGWGGGWRGLGVWMARAWKRAGGSTRLRADIRRSIVRGPLRDRTDAYLFEPCPLRPSHGPGVLATLPAMLTHVGRGRGGRWFGVSDGGSAVGSPPGSACSSSTSRRAGRASGTTDASHSLHGPRAVDAAWPAVRFGSLWFALVLWPLARCGLINLCFSHPGNSTS